MSLPSVTREPIDDGPIPRVARVSGGEWRDARVRHAEEALAEAVRTADEIMADAVADPAPPREEPPEEEPPPTILRDAW